MHLITLTYCSYNKYITDFLSYVFVLFLCIAFHKISDEKGWIWTFEESTEE